MERQRIKDECMSADSTSFAKLTLVTKVRYLSSNTHIVYIKSKLLPIVVLRTFNVYTSIFVYSNSKPNKRRLKFLSFEAIGDGIVMFLITFNFS